MLGEMGFDEQQLRLENARLKEEVRILFFIIIFFFKLKNIYYFLDSLSGCV